MLCLLSSQIHFTALVVPLSLLCILCFFFFFLINSPHHQVCWALKGVTKREPTSIPHPGYSSCPGFTTLPPCACMMPPIPGPCWEFWNLVDIALVLLFLPFPGYTLRNFYFLVQAYLKPIAIPSSVISMCGHFSFLSSSADTLAHHPASCALKPQAFNSTFSTNLYAF